MDRQTRLNLGYVAATIFMLLVFQVLLVAVEPYDDGPLQRVRIRSQAEKNQ